MPQRADAGIQADSPTIKAKGTGGKPSLLRVHAVSQRQYTQVHVVCTEVYTPHSDRVTHTSKYIASFLE
jgi:hypothetical protein